MNTFHSFVNVFQCHVLIGHLCSLLLCTLPVYEIDDWEVERDQVTLLEALGQGFFGMVYHGLFLPSAENEQEALHVAVKVL